MAMFSIRYKDLINEFPSESQAIARLAEFIEAKQEKQAFSSRYTIDRFWELTQPSSFVNLTKILRILVKDQILDVTYQIESVAGGGIKELDSLTSIPESIHDWRQDIVVPVYPENIHIYYKLHKADA
jgi:hypothetical protein